MPSYRQLLPLRFACRLAAASPSSPSSALPSFLPHQTLYSCLSSPPTNLCRHLLNGSSAFCCVLLQLPMLLLFLYQNVRTMKLFESLFLSLRLAVHTTQHNLSKQKVDINMYIQSCSMSNKMNAYIHIHIQCDVYVCVFILSCVWCALVLYKLYYVHNQIYHAINLRES